MKIPVKDIVQQCMTVQATWKIHANSISAEWQEVNLAMKGSQGF